VNPQASLQDHHHLLRFVLKTVLAKYATDDIHPTPLLRFVMPVIYLSNHCKPHCLLLFFPKPKLSTVTTITQILSLVAPPHQCHLADQPQARHLRATLPVAVSQHHHCAHHLSVSAVLLLLLPVQFLTPLPFVGYTFIPAKVFFKLHTLPPLIDSTETAKT